MVLLHIAHIETAVVGGVNIAVPKMVNSQKEFADVGIINLTGEAISSVPTFSATDVFAEKLPSAFNKPDLVIFHEVYRPEFLNLARFFSAKKIPYLIIPHGCLTKTAQHKKFLKKWTANLLLFHTFLKNALSIQYLSYQEQEQSAFSYPSIVLPNGIHLPEEETRTPLSDSLKLLYIGRLEWHIKGFDLLFDAIHREKDFLRTNHTTLTIYGPKNDPSRKKLQSLIDRYDISDLIILSGEVWGEEKKKVFLSADYFIQTSRSEGMPMGLLEALAHGLPAIVTEGTGFAKTVTEYQCGIGCNTTKQSIALAIKQAVQEKNSYLTRSKNARNLISENYEEKAVAKNAVTAYRTLLS